MIDLHSHILPGVDDGPDSMEEALQMARMAVADGIQTIVATPHVRHPAFNVTPDKRDGALAQLDTCLKAEGIPLQVLPGAEVYVFDGMIESIKADSRLGLAGGSWILLEWPNSMSLELVKPIIFDAQVKGVNLLLAHAERHPDANSQPLMEDLVRAGLRLQVNAITLAKRFGGKPSRIARRLVREGLCYVIASDSHDSSRRLPHLSPGLEIAKKLVGPKAEALVRDNPRKVVG